MKGGLGHSGEGKEIQRLLPQSAAPFTWWPSPAPIWISLPAVWAPGWMSLDLPHLHHRHGPQGRHCRMWAISLQRRQDACR